MGSWYYRDYAPSVPKEVKGGIKAQTRQGAFGKSWWAKRWISVLESFDIGARLGRGRSYARRGQVMSVEIVSGVVTAKVQGSRSTPYSVTINVKTLSKTEWKTTAESLSRQAYFVAKLLAGEMPENIEDVFKEVKLSLFPERLRDLKTECSCPDWSNPCKHIAAVYYLLGEEFDRDPFLIFKLRGMERGELIGLLDGSSALQGNNGKQRAVALLEEESTASQYPPEPLPLDPETFWGSSLRCSMQYPEVSIPKVAAALPKRLGSFPMWRGEERFHDALEHIYSAASSLGLELMLGEAGQEKERINLNTVPNK